MSQWLQRPQHQAPPGQETPCQPPSGLLSYRRHSCLLGLCTRCRSLGTRGQAVLRGVSRFGGLRDLLAHSRRALGKPQRLGARQQTVQTGVGAGMGGKNLQPEVSAPCAAQHLWRMEVAGEH